MHSKRDYSLYTWGLENEEGLYKQSPIKRLFDIALSGAGLILSIPLWIIITVLIYLETGRPIFFVQKRIGRNGKAFKFIKFRSMVKDAEAKTLGLHDKELPKEMVTKIGRVLRDTAMDELPQLINIFKGDMSFVGPRAAPSLELHSLTPQERDMKLSIMPGLTGIAQLYGRDDTPARQKLRLDKLYIKKKNFWLDLKLIFLSFIVSIRAKWKSRGKKYIF